jgi:hypothetical protein
MNFKSIIVLGLSVATLGLSLPAHAGDTSTVINTTQDAVVTGNGNTTSQSSRNTVNNRQTGRKTGGDTGTSITTGQSADVLGDGNRTDQKSRNDVHNVQHRSK